MRSRDGQRKGCVCECERVRPSLSPHRAVRATNEKIKKKKKIAINTNLPLFTHCICNNNVGASGQSKKDDETSCLVFFFFIHFFIFFLRGLPKESVNWYVLHIAEAWPRANLTFDVCLA